MSLPNERHAMQPCHKAQSTLGYFTAVDPEEAGSRYDFSKYVRRVDCITCRKCTVMATLSAN